MRCGGGEGEGVGRFHVLIGNSDTFLRNPPIGIAAHQRIAIQSLGHAMDAVQVLVSRLREVSKHLVETESLDNPALQVELFVLAWGIVDHGHALMQLIKYLQKRGIEGNRSQEFVSKFGSIKKMRDCMDHLKDNIGNLANANQNRNPIFGTLSFAVWDKTEESVPKAGRIITVASGATISNGISDAIFPTLNPGSKILIEFPLGCFEYYAFGETLDISEFWRDTVELQKAFNENLAPQVFAQLKSSSLEAGLDPEISMGQAGAGWLIVMEFELGDIT
jgi:hypothetical protein